MKDHVLRSPVLDPTPALFLIAAISALLYSMENARWAALLLPGVILLPSIAYLLSKNISIALGVLIASAAMPRYFVQISGMNARPEHIVTGLLFLAAVSIYRRGSEAPRWIAADLIVLAFIGMNVFSSIFMSIAPSQTFKWSMQQMLVIVPYFLIRLLAGNAERFRQAVRIMLLVGTLEAAYGVVCFYSNRLFGSEFGVDVGQYGDIPGIYGSQFEANLLGSYCGACLVIMLLMYFRERSRKFLWGSAITYAGLVISLSRAAIAAAMVALVVLVMYSLRARMVSLQVLRRAGLVLLAVTVILAASVAPLYLERFGTLDVSDPTADDTTKVRVLSLGVAAERSLEHPVFGGGTNSFQLDFDYKEIGYTDVDTGGWIGNTELRVWHDTGLIGLAIFLLFLGFLVTRAWRAIRGDSPPELLGLLLAGVVYCISFQTTDGTILSFPWIHLGLIAAGTTLSNTAEGNGTEAYLPT